MTESKHILITNCSDPMFWYAHHVGKSFPLLRVDSLTGEYITRASDGFLNIVKPHDSEIINNGNHKKMNKQTFIIRKSYSGFSHINGEITLLSKTNYEKTCQRLNSYLSKKYPSLFANMRIN